MQGYMTIEVAMLEGVGQAAITARLAALRDRFGAATNEQLIATLIKRGLIDIGEIKGYNKVGGE